MTTRSWLYGGRLQQKGESIGGGQGMLRGHIIDAQGVQRLIQISLLIVPSLGWILFR